MRQLLRPCSDASDRLCGRPIRTSTAFTGPNRLTQRSRATEQQTATLPQQLLLLTGCSMASTQCKLRPFFWPKKRRRCMVEKLGTTTLSNSIWSARPSEGPEYQQARPKKIAVLSLTDLSGLARDGAHQDGVNRVTITTCSPASVSVMFSQDREVQNWLFQHKTRTAGLQSSVRIRRMAPENPRYR